MGDVILFPRARRGVAWSEEPRSAVGAALHAARAEPDDEWLDRLGAAIALGRSRELRDGPPCDVVPIRNK